MKKALFVVLLLVVSLVSSAQSRRIEYGDLDSFLIPKSELVSYIEEIDFNYDTTSKNKLCLDIRRKYSLSIVYDNDDNVTMLIIENPPYLTMSVWNLCLLDSRGRLCYLYRAYTYSIQYNKNELRLTRI